VHTDAVHDRAHRVLADAERDVSAGPLRREEAAAFELRLRGLDEVGGTADHRRNGVLEHLHDLLAGIARRHVVAGLELGHAPGCDLPGIGRVPHSAYVGERMRPRLERLPPLVLGGDAALDGVHVLGDLLRDDERLIGIPAERLLRRPHLVLAERAPVRLRGVHGMRRAVRDV
jgi:hypothetical protein